MSSGKRVLALSSLLASFVGSVSFAHDADGLRALMASLATIEASRVAYRETKSMDILDSMVEQSGFLSFAAPATVIREIREPLVETYAIVGNTMHVTREGREERIDLDSIPLLRAFIESFRATLSGDVDLLEAHYHVDFSGDGPMWRLELRPRNRRLAGFIESIEFTGEETRVDRIRISEANGDWSLMILSPAEQGNSRNVDNP